MDAVRGRTPKKPDRRAAARRRADKLAVKLEANRRAILGADPKLVSNINGMLERTHDLLTRAVAEVSFVNVALPTRLRLSRGDHEDDTGLKGRTRLYVIVATLERDSGEEVEAQFGDDAPVAIETYQQAVDFVYERVRSAWIHELNEAMFVDGVRRRNLHQDNGSTIELQISEIETTCTIAKR
jgi:hypothetical protein